MTSSIYLLILHQLSIMTMTCLGQPLLTSMSVEQVNRKSNPNEIQEGQQRIEVEVQEEPSHEGFLDLTTVPQPLIQVKLHSDLVLTCQARGSPSPRIRWVVDGQESFFGMDDDILTQTSWGGSSSSLSSSGSMRGSGQSGFEMATVTSTLRLPCIRPEEEAQYSCIVDSGPRTLRRSTKVVITEEDDTSNDPSQECEIKLAHYFEQSGQGIWDIPARVMTSESLHMAPMGSDALLPCRAVGQPRPKIIWTDGEGLEVVSSGSKFEVLSNGDLMIRDLAWTDMGEFTCSAINKFATHSADPTFLYPLPTLTPLKK